MKLVLTADEAMELTTPYHSDWADAHEAAWATWAQAVRDFPEFVKPLGTSERYAILHRHITDRAASALDGRVISTERLGFFAQILDGRALVRFKHLTSGLTPRNYQTDQQQYLTRQEFTPLMMEQLALDGIQAPLTVLTVGYTLTIGEDELSQILVVCHHNHQLLYSYPISENGAGTGTIPQALPITPPPTVRVVSARPTLPTETGSERDS